MTASEVSRRVASTLGCLSVPAPIGERIASAACSQGTLAEGASTADQLVRCACARCTRKSGESYRAVAMTHSVANASASTKTASASDSESGGLPAGLYAAMHMQAYCNAPSVHPTGNSRPSSDVALAAAQRGQYGPRSKSQSAQSCGSGDAISSAARFRMSSAVGTSTWIMGGIIA